jgi:hypothetical protein
MESRYSAYRRGSDTIPPDVIDRVLLGACAAIWLVLLGVSVAAGVALADLGRGFHKTAGGSHTTWVLYAVIVVSALIIAGAIPVLLRARHTGRVEPADPSINASARAAARFPGTPGSAIARTQAERARQQQQRVQASGAPTEWSGAAADRVWLRGTVLLVATMGGALIAVAAATYLMAIGHDGASWVGYALSGVVTAAMPVLEWRHVRQLREVVAAY